MQRIVVGVDSAGSADNAVSVAIELAQRFHASIELVHAVPAPHHLQHGVSEQDLEAARRAVRLRLSSSLPGALLPYVGEEHHLVVQPGHPARVLLERAAVPGTSLLVIGSHRRRGLFDLRSTAHVLLSRAECPVWVQEGPVRQIRRILVPVDLSQESLLSLASACAWAAAFDAGVTALHCYESPELGYAGGHPMPGPTIHMETLRNDARQEFERAMARFAWGAVRHDAVFVEASPAQKILQMQDDVDLIAMGTHGRTGLSGVILGNVAQSVVRQAHVPVVTMRMPGRGWIL